MQRLFAPGDWPTIIALHVLCHPSCSFVTFLCRFLLCDVTFCNLPCFSLSAFPTLLLQKQCSDWAIGRGRTVACAVPE